MASSLGFAFLRVLARCGAASTPGGVFGIVRGRLGVSGELGRLARGVVGLGPAASRPPFRVFGLALGLCHCLFELGALVGLEAGLGRRQLSRALVARASASAAFSSAAFAERSAS